MSPARVYVDDEEKSVYIYETPRGLDGSEEFTLYLPGRPTSDLPAGFINYIMQATNDFTSYERMRYWGLRNMGTERGLRGHERQSSPANRRLEKGEAARAFARAAFNSPPGRAGRGRP